MSLESSINLNFNKSIVSLNLASSFLSKFFISLGCGFLFFIEPYFI